MRRSVGAVALGIFALCVLARLACAQDAAPAPLAFESEPFAGSDLTSGKRIAEAECAALPGAVWVVVDQQGECIRYYLSTAGGSGPAAVVFTSPEVASTGSYLKESPATVQTRAAAMSRFLQMPYMLLARPGAFGSSGEYAKRRTEREIDLISTALDAIKARHGYTRLHLAGYSEGGHAAAALLARRNDIGCAVLASALLSVRSRLGEFGRTEDWTGNKNPVDPIALVRHVSKRPDLRIFLLTDPDDNVISARSQTTYFRQLLAAALPAHQLFVAARDPYSHSLSNEAVRVVADCAKGVADDTIVATHQNKVPYTLPDADDPPLHAPGMLTRAVVINQAECKALETALWVRVDGRDFCVRYWMSTAGVAKEEAIVFVHGDLGDADSPTQLNQYSALVSAGRMLRNAHQWARVYGGAYIYIGRLGTYGSSGSHSDRRSPLEVRVVMAALDGLKARHGFKRFHLAGQSGGAHTVAAMVQMRDDIGCAVMASGTLSLKTGFRHRGIPAPAHLYDPIDFVRKMKPQPERRMIVMLDPDDQVVPFPSPVEFVERVRAQGLAVLQIAADAGVKTSMVSMRRLSVW